MGGWAWLPFMAVCPSQRVSTWLRPTGDLGANLSFGGGSEAPWGVPWGNHSVSLLVQLRPWTPAPGTACMVFTQSFCLTSDVSSSLSLPRLRPQPAPTLCPFKARLFASKLHRIALVRLLPPRQRTQKGRRGACDVPTVCPHLTSVVCAVTGY